MNVADWLKGESTHIRAAAARQLSAWVREAADETTRVEVTDCFALFAIPAGALVSTTTAEFVQALDFARRWHVQVAMDGRPIGYARGQETAAGFSIESWTHDGLCHGIDRAIDVADAAAVDDSHLAVVVEVEAFDLCALVLVPRAAGTLWLIVVAASDTALQGTLGQLLTADAFLAAIRSSVPVQGIAPEA